MADIIGGLSLAVRHWRNGLSIAFIFGVIAVVMSFILSDVLTQVQSLRGGAKLRDHHAVAFTPVYPAGRVSDVSSESFDLLAAHIEQGTAYSAVINNLAVSDPGAFGGENTILVVGERAFDMFPSLGPGCRAPCVLRGVSFHGARTESFRGIDLAPGGELPRGAVWFDPNAAGLNLDDYQVVVLSPGEFASLDEYQREELITKTVLLHPALGAVEQFLRAVADAELYLVPSDLAHDQTELFAGIMTRASLYVLALTAFSLLALGVYASVVRGIIVSEAKSLTIRRLCGAASRHLAVRLLVFLAATVLIVPLFFCGALWLMGPPLDQAAMLMVGVVFFIYLAFVSTTFLVSRKEITIL